MADLPVVPFRAPATLPPVSAALNQTRGKRENPKSFRNRGRGTSSLRSTALRSCIWQMEYFEPSTFADVDWKIAEIIYKRLLETDTLSPIAWRIFCTAYPDEVPNKHHISLFGKPNSRPLLVPAIPSFINSLLFETITLLSIHCLHFCPSDLTALLSITNLAVLYLEQDLMYTDGHNQSCFALDSRVMWKWGRAVHEKQAFQKLRAVVLKRFHAALDDVLGGLAMFPAILYLIVDSRDPKKDRLVDCKGMWERLPEPNASDDASTNVLALLMVNHLTTTVKMRRIYDAACVALQEPPLGLHSSCVTINYRSPLPTITPTNYLGFKRLRGETSSDRSGGKRDGESDHGDEGANSDRSKKRKVRGGKQKDIGALLGDFA